MAYDETAAKYMARDTSARAVIEQMKAALGTCELITFPNGHGPEKYFSRHDVAAAIAAADKWLEENK